MPVWPSTLPSIEVGMTEERQDPVLRSPTSVGPPKARRIASAAMRTLSGSMTLDASQYATFRDFYELDADYGSEPFDFTDPVDGSTVRAMFLGPYSAVHSVGQNGVTTVYRVSFRVGVLP